MSCPVARARTPTSIVSLDSAPSPTRQRHSRDDHFVSHFPELGHRNAPRISIGDRVTPVKRDTRQGFSPRNLRDGFHPSVNSREELRASTNSREDFSPRSLRGDFHAASTRLRDDYSSSISSREDFLPATSSRERFRLPVATLSARYPDDEEYSPRSHGEVAGGMRRRPRPRAGSTSHRSAGGHSGEELYFEDHGRPRDRSRSPSPASRFRRSFQQ